MSKLTERALIESFFTLLKKRSLKKITVSDITNECGVNRMTFYYHFENINDLIQKAFEKRFLGAISGEINENNWRDAFLELYRSIYQSKDFVKKLYPEFDVKELITFITPVAHSLVKCAIGNRASQLNAESKNKIFQFYQCSIVGSFLYWLESDLNENPDKIFSSFEELLESSLPALIEKCDKNKRNATF
ncbi:MAG: TetR/AcrR family transcriptional regulator C-terminal domain-containing protein [Clostridia bacterium]|nr:TetR/AcrR family transcriptional regulator C-terminal domain-containing protein [Clostridia bacterium]